MARSRMISGGNCEVSDRAIAILRSYHFAGSLVDRDQAPVECDGNQPCPSTARRRGWLDDASRDENPLPARRGLVPGSIFHL